MASVAVVGAGIIGLSSAVCILERDPTIKVTVITDKLTPNTTSDGAAGLIRPLFIGNSPNHLQRKWFKTTMDELERLSQRDDSGQDLAIYKTTLFYVADEKVEWSTINKLQLNADKCKELLIDIKKVKHHFDAVTVNSQELEREPFWRDLVDGYRLLSQKELAHFPKPTKFGYSFTTLCFNGKYYLPWLIERLKRLGGIITMKTIESLEELAGTYDVVVNCTGMRARELVNDCSLYPVRGQILRVYAPWIKHAYDRDTKEHASCGKHCYILPQANGEVVLGGTAYHNNFDTRVDADDTRHILEATSQLVPSLKRAKVIDAWVGLRPFRSSVRLEKEEKRFEDKIGQERCLKIVHNYGHGGSGLTMHWGCAMDTTDLVFEFLAAPKQLHARL